MAAMKKLEITIDGMHCQACVAKVHDALESIGGVTSAEVQLGSAEVTFDEQVCAAKVLIDAVRGSGFQLGGFKTMDADS